MAMAEGQTAFPAKDLGKVFVSYSHHDARHRAALSDQNETGMLLQRLGAEPGHAALVLEATGGHPEWTALGATEVRGGRLAGLSRLYYDGLLIERGESTVFRCEAARLAAERVLGVGGPVP